MGATNNLKKLRITALLLAYLFMIGKTLLLGVDINFLYTLTISNFIVPNAGDPDNGQCNFAKTLFQYPRLLLIYGCIHTLLMLVDTVVGLIGVFGVHLKYKRLLEIFFITALVTLVLNFVILFVALYRNAQHYDKIAWNITGLEIVLHRILSLVCIIVIIYYYSRIRGDDDRRRDSEIIANYVEHVRYM